MKIKETFYFKGRDGYQAESTTETDANGNIWTIKTTKGRGRVYTYANQGQDSGNGMITYNLSEMMGGDTEKYFRCLAEEAGQCNEAKVRRVHEAGVKAFFERIQSQPAAAAPYILAPGQIIYNDSGRKNTAVIYEVTRPGHFKIVTLDGKQLAQADTLTIGKSYTEGNFMPLDEVQELVKAATAEQQRQREEAERRATAAAIERSQKIAQGIKIVPSIPEGVKAVIVANLRQDESDIQSDYFHSTTVKQVFLAWSEHTRDIFSELRKAAGKFEETKQYSTAPAMPENANPEYWKPEDEHREKYTGGHGYFLGTSKYSGWIVEKENLGQYGPTLETIQIAAAEGRYLCNEAPQATEPATAQHEAPEVITGTVQIVDYSLKAIAVIGDTKPIKDKLKALGGKFNFRLSCGPGWIFPKSKLSEIQKALTKPTPEPVEDFSDKSGNINQPPTKFIELTATPETPEALRHPEVEPAHPLNICDPAGSQYKEALKEYNAETAPEPETIPEEPTEEEAEAIAEEVQKYCTPRPAPAFFTANVSPEEANDREFIDSLPDGTGDGHGYTHKPAFFRENGATTAAEQRAQAQQNGLKLYSETRQGVNTGRAQQGFLF